MAKASKRAIAQEQGTSESEEVALDAVLNTDEAVATDLQQNDFASSPVDDAIEDADPTEGDDGFLESLRDLDVDALTESEVDELLDQLVPLTKPGLIIDGQHRVLGTFKDNILFNVCALPDSPWPELAFQFIVLNLSSKKVDESLLINIVGNSMTPGELESIDDRLNESGINVALYQGIMRIHDDPDSPFYQKLRFGLDEENGIIDARSAKSKLVGFWFGGQMIYPLVVHLLDGSTKAAKLEFWKTSGKWYDYYKAFWGEAQRFYASNSSLWSNDLEPGTKTPVSRLMRVTVINLTQIAFIEHMKKVMHDKINNDPTRATTMASLLPDVVAFAGYVKMYFQRLKPEFFSDWGPSARGLDGSIAVKKAYVEAVTDVINQAKTIPQLKAENKNLIFKG
jgi:hypothetical protein